MNEAEETLLKDRLAHIEGQNEDLRGSLDRRDATINGMAKVIAELREEVARLASDLRTEETLYRGACDVAGGDPVQTIYSLRAEIAQLRAALEK